METKNLVNTLIALSSLRLATAQAEPMDEHYETVKQRLKQFTQSLVLDECQGQEGFDFDAFQWDNYELIAFQTIISSIANHTENYCKPPELSGMHRSTKNQGDDGDQKKDGKKQTM